MLWFPRKISCNFFWKKNQIPGMISRRIEFEFAIWLILVQNSFKILINLSGIKKIVKKNYLELKIIKYSFYSPIPSRSELWLVICVNFLLIRILIHSVCEILIYFWLRSVFKLGIGLSVHAMVLLILNLLSI